MIKKSGRKAKELTDEEKQWIRYNLDRADLTYVNPGRKDYIYIGKKRWKATILPKKISTVREFARPP